ncbi:MAG: PQQ-binding-like beta-propeller repeat protein [Verrucomicrobia bacterium]|nr:PQQ-binding-like beta-propeller repeat protein [Verrucomicrobiota bacterium]
MLPLDCKTFGFRSGERERAVEAPLAYGRGYTWRFFTAFAVFCCLGLFGCSERAAAPDAKIGNSKSAATPDIAWPMTRGSPALSGSVAANVPLNPKTAWTFSAPASVTAEAAIVNGRVYVGTAKGTLHCLAAETGRELWHFDTQEAITAAPAVSGAVVFLSSNDGRLYALNADTGAEVWRFAIEDKISSGAIVIQGPGGEGDWVLLNGYDGITRALNATDGRVIWTYKTDDFINGAPAVVDGRYVVFGGCDAQVHVVNLKDGSLVHKIPTSAQIPASIGTFGTMAFCGNYANQAVAFDVLGGKVAWVYEDHALPFFSSPAVNDRLVLIGSRDKHLHAIDRKTGKIVWKFRTGGRVEGSPIVFANGVVFGSSDGRLYAASLDAGTELWQLDLGESLVTSTAFGHRQIIVSGEKGTVFAIRDRTAPKT